MSRRPCALRTVQRRRSRTVSSRQTPPAATLEGRHRVRLMSGSVGTGHDGAELAEALEAQMRAGRGRRALPGPVGGLLAILPANVAAGEPAMLA